MWSMVRFLLESLISSLVGLELPTVVGALRSHSLALLVGYAVLITLSAIVTRLRRRRGKVPRPPWSEAAFVGWTGMRGGDSLVIALALPFVTATGEPFPARDLIVFLTFSVIVGTLVIQGLTLVPLLHRLRLSADGEADTEEAHAQRVAAEAGLRRLEEAAHGDGADATALEYLRGKYTANDCAAGGRALGDDVMRRVQRELDLETMLLRSAEDDAPESRYDSPQGRSLPFIRVP
jgi:monovalent cation/hydrogen antiporter